MNGLVIPARLWEGIVCDATALVPLEEGGILLGRRGPDGLRLVSHVVGSGPGARRTRTWLEVDHEWQNARVRELHAGGAAIGYLGEWHSHPDAMDGTMSSQDRRTLAQLAAFQPLGCPDPLMVIVHPRGTGWDAAVWALSASRQRGRIPVRVPAVIPAEFRLIENNVLPN